MGIIGLQRYLRKINTKDQLNYTKYNIIDFNNIIYRKLLNRKTYCNTVEKRINIILNYCQNI